MKKQNGKVKSTKRTQVKHKKGLQYQFTIYFLSVIAGIAVFVGGKLAFQQTIPCANSSSCQSDLTEKIENGAIGTFEGKKIPAPAVNLAQNPQAPSILGANTPSQDKHIYVDLSSQILYAYEGSQKVFQTFVATGRWNKTPVGNFHIWTKIRSTRMSGGEGDDAYDLPNVPFVMYFYHDFGLHGAYWHDNFGHTMSHGCVNLRQIDAETLYNWADGPTNDTKGTAVSICDSFTEPNMCVQTNPIED